MKTLKKIFLTVCVLPTCLFSQTPTFKFEKTQSFFANNRFQSDASIEWGYLTVPENWDIPGGKTIKIATAILKSTQKTEAANPVVFIQGGPGAGGIGSIWNFLNHPLRKENDIVLIDVRGTGFSFPALCPDLGKKFLEILSENNIREVDEQQKTIAAIACKQDLIDKNIDIHSYNSKSIAKDLNALKMALGYATWNVYGVSYGTYMAQVYANDFPADIKSVILDSPVSDVSKYYVGNTTNYMNSLKKVFVACEKNSISNACYPDLERKYFETIDKLEKNPITVNVDKRIISSGEFTYNAEDFKVAIQQSLYNKRLIEVLPVLITEFNKGNKNTLSSLVGAFSGAFGLNYGMYYCVTCDEIIPYNSIEEFNKDALHYGKLNGGLSFYKSDFAVCDKWNSGASEKPSSASFLTDNSALTAPVLVISGDFDPITPSSNGEQLVAQFKNGFLVKAPLYGHAPSFSYPGFDLVNEFINNPMQKPTGKEFETGNTINFVTDVNLNPGVTQLANSLQEADFLFFSPLLIALIISVIAIFNFIYLIIKHKKYKEANQILKYLIICSCVIGLISIVGFISAIDRTANYNFYILAFGLPKSFSYLFMMLSIFIVLTVISTAYFFIKFKKISNKSSMSSILFSLILICIYFQYWGF
jgi:pimeloyl-ACP methyl ester carboxylesterase